MASERSPYREFGLSPRTLDPKRKKIDLAKGLAAAHDRLRKKKRRAQLCPVEKCTRLKQEGAGRCFFHDNVTIRGRHL